MRHIFLAGVLAVAIMGCEGEQGCEVQESEIDCFEAAVEEYQGYLDHLSITGNSTDEGMCRNLAELRENGCEDLLMTPVICEQYEF